MKILSKIQRIPHYVDNQVYSTLSSVLEMSYGMANPRLRKLIGQPAYRMVQLQVRLNPYVSGVAYRIRGASKVDGRPLTVAFVGKWETGQRNSLSLYQHFLFEESSTEMECLGEYPARQFRGMAVDLANQVDMVAFLATNLLLWRPNQGDWASGPAGIRTVFDFHPNEIWANIENRMKSQRENIRVLKKAGFSYCVSEKEEDFHDFYHNMYVPMVKSRYQDFGDILNEQGLFEVFKKNGYIMKIIDSNGIVIAGGFYMINRGVLYALLNGVPGGEQIYIKKGGLNATYYFGLKWAFEQGLTRYDAGVCPSFVNNGLYLHKSRWGLQPELNYWKPNSILFWAPQSSPAALAWMEANPFLPQFARWGGPNLTPFYTELASQDQAAKVLAES